MSNRGLLGAFAGAGKGLNQVGTIFLQDNLETLRQERLAKIQADRDVKLFGQQKEMADIKHSQTTELQESKMAHESGLLENKQGFEGGENQKDRDLKMDIAQLETDAKRKAAEIKAGNDNKSAADKKYMDSVERWKQLYNSDKKGTADYDNVPAHVMATLYSEAYGIGERLINQSTNEVTFTGINTKGELGVTAEYVRPEGGSRREREFRNVEPPQDTGLLDNPPPAPGGQAPLDPAKYAKVKGDYSGYKDGTYKAGDGKMVTIRGGVAYIEK